MKRLFTFEIVAVIYTDQFLNCTMKKELKPEIRAYIKGRAALKIPPRNVYKELTDIYRSSTVSFMTVSRWMKKFKTGIWASVKRVPAPAPAPHLPLVRKRNALV